MLLIIECVIACILFTCMIIPSLYKNPIAHIMSYPTEIRRRVESLPEYADSINHTERKHLSAKMISIFVFAVVLAVIAYLSGATVFITAFVHVFIIFFVVNIYDLLILDIIMFCNSERVRIPGTEDMVKEYHNPRHHIIGAVKGTMIGIAVAFIAGGIVEVINCIMR